MCRDFSAILVTWGLRDYGGPALVWGGDANCLHAWADATVVDSRHLPESDPTPKQASNAGSHQRGIKPGAFCQHCGAWRGQLGLEPTPDLHIAHLVEIFREVRRVLRPDGTVWLNYGDCYATGVNGRSAADTKALSDDDRTFRDKPFTTAVGGLKPKDLCMMPARLAIALQEDGWWIRSEIIWHKSNPMPESIADRPATAHEKVYLLSKSARYFYDAEAVREASINGKDAYKMPDGWNTAPGAHGSFHPKGREKGKPADKVRGLTPRHEGHVNHTTLDETERGFGRNLRNVWTIATAPFAEAHFATFPPALVEPCIKAGTSEKGCCPDCGAPMKRVTERQDQGWDGSRYGERAVVATGGAKSGGTAKSTLGSSNGKLTGKSETLGWTTTCLCGEAQECVPCTVLDPFGGAGTVGLVAKRLGREAILIELKPEYAEIAAARIRADLGSVEGVPHADGKDLPLFAGATA